MLKLRCLGIVGFCMFMQTLMTAYADKAPMLECTRSECVVAFDEYSTAEAIQAWIGGGSIAGLKIYLRSDSRPSAQVAASGVLEKLERKDNPSPDFDSYQTIGDWQIAYRAWQQREQSISLMGWGSEVGSDRPTCRIEIDGSLTTGYTDVVFREMLNRAKQARCLVEYVDLNSPGGHVAVGMSVGRLVYDNALTTVVDGIGICASACSSIFIASRAGRHAAGRLDEEYSFNERTPAVAAKVLLHSWFYKNAANLSDDNYREGHELTEEQLRKFLRDVGVPEKVVEWMKSIPSSEVRPFSPSQWTQIGEYPASLRELIIARCGELMDDWKASSNAVEKGELKGPLDICVRSAVEPIQRSAQWGAN